VVGVQGRGIWVLDMGVGIVLGAAGVRDGAAVSACYLWDDVFMFAGGCKRGGLLCVVRLVCGIMLADCCVRNEKEAFGSLYMIGILILDTCFQN
jgi:hypothetical protein